MTPQTPHGTAPRRTQAERRSESEDALLAAAAELVAERGLAGASLANIGERAGTSRGLPTHHFGSKDALVERLAVRAQDRIQEALEQATASATASGEARPGGPAALDAICRMVDVYLERFEDPTPEERALLVLWGSTFPSSASVAIMHEADRRSYEGIADLVADGHRDGSIRADLDPAATAVVILGTMRGTAALLITHRETADVRRVREDCRRIVANALGS